MQKVTKKIGQKKCLSFKTVIWRYVSNKFNGKEIRIAFYKKKLQKSSQSELQLKSVEEERNGKFNLIKN